MPRYRVSTAGRAYSVGTFLFRRYLKIRQTPTRTKRNHLNLCSLASLCIASAVGQSLQRHLPSPHILSLCCWASCSCAAGRVPEVPLSPSLVDELVWVLFDFEVWENIAVSPALRKGWSGFDYHIIQDGGILV